MPRVHIVPPVDPSVPDPGDGGIGRVVRGQYATLPGLGWEVVSDPEAADVIACHVEIPPTYLRLYPDKPFVTHLHGAYWTDGGYSWEQWSYLTNARLMAAVRASDMVTSVSEWTAQTFRRNTMRDVRVITHGVDLDDWTPPESHGGYVLWNKTRVDPICDPAPMNAAARLLPRTPFVSTFGSAAPNVELTGKLSYAQGKELVRRAGVYLATTRETFGIGTLEALAAGVPVVGYAFGGQVEIIEHGVDGWLVRPGDVEGLAEGIEWALIHRDEISPRARAKAEQFPVERSGQAYADLYDEVLTRHRAEHAPDRPRISVIVPAYKMGDYLGDTLATVLAQDAKDWECIVVNDASPDPRDHEIAQRYVQADPRFREIVLPENGYLANARNVGIAAARGRYIFPLDADDMITDITLTALADALDRDHSLHIAYGNVRFTLADGKTLSVWREARERGLPDGHSGWPIPFNLEWMLRGPGQLLPYASMFRRTVWEQTGGYRTRSRSSEDQDFWLRASSYGFTPAMVTEADTLIYRQRPDSMSSAAGEGWEEHRGWFPWAGENGDRALVPGGAIQESKPAEMMPLPAFDPAPIAVVIPVGPGHGKYVIDAIDSVDAQTFRNWECIVVNDSGEALPPLPSWVKVIESPTGRFGGAAAARNAGIAVTRATTFLPLDADDYLQPKALELMWESIISDSTPAVVYSDFYEDPHEAGKFQVYQTPDYDPWHLIRRGCLHAVTALTPRQFWVEVGGYDPALAWEDWAFSIAVAAKGHCSRRIALPLFTYRKHTGMRRNDNHEHFEESKAAIMRKDFGLTERGELLACQTCGGGGRATATTGFSPFTMGAQQSSPVPQDAVLIEYTGPREGTFRMRSGVNPSVSYAFSKTRNRGYVHKQDAEQILQRNDFALVDPGAIALGVEMASGPALVAAREPVMVGAAVGASGAGPMGIIAPDNAPSPVASGWSTDTSAVPQMATTPPAIAADPSRTVPQRAPAGDRPLTPTEQALVDKNTRDQLNQMARDMGIENPEDMDSKSALAKVIAITREMKAS